MKYVIKVMLTLLVVGTLLILIAACVQGFNQQLADLFGYTGLAMYGIDVFIFAVVALVFIWSDGFDD